MKTFRINLFGLSSLHFGKEVAFEIKQKELLYNPNLSS